MTRRKYNDEVANFLRPHARVEWISKYDEKRRFAGVVVRVIGDRAVVRGDGDNKLLVIPTYRLLASTGIKSLDDL